MKVKCRFCDAKDTERDDMLLHIIETETGNKYNRYYHKECYPKYLQHQEFLDKEKVELDFLFETIKEVHKIETVPDKFYPFLQDLRNGNVLNGKIKKKYKSGYPYTLIAKTYLFCRESIEYWKKNKDFKDSTMSELKYCWAIINDKINAVKKREEKKEFQARQQKIVENKYNNEIKTEQVETNYKKKKDELDISDFL